MLATKVFGLIAVLTVVSVSPMTIAAPSGNPESGRKIYLESYQSCHGPTGKGDSDMAAYLTPRRGRPMRIYERSYLRDDQGPRWQASMGHSMRTS